jgi:short-subunit dehydrogenase
MRDLNGRNALVTGGSGGIGVYIARALARAGANVVVCGRREDALGEVAAELREMGVRADAVTADLYDLTQLDSLIDRSEAALGPLDVLVNNAGVENAAEFARYTRDELTSMVDLNLTAPLLLTHRVLPGMLERGRGHVVFIASMAGKLGLAYVAPYVATKAGLIAATHSLRAEHMRGPVGFSVICPGFVSGDGMYQRMLDEGFSSNRLVGSTTIEKVADKVIDAIRRDRPEVIESGGPVRPLLALAQVAPGVVERLAPRIGLTELFRRVATSRGRAA